MSWFSASVSQRGKRKSFDAIDWHGKTILFSPWLIQHLSSCCDNSCWNSDVTMATKKHLRLVRTHQSMATQTMIRSKMTISLYNRVWSHQSRLGNQGNKNMAHNLPERARWLSLSVLLQAVLCILKYLCGWWESWLQPSKPPAWLLKKI